MASSQVGLARSLRLLALVALLETGLSAQQTPRVSGAASSGAETDQRGGKGRTRITEAVNDAEVTRIPFSKHPLAVAANDRGRVDANQPMERMMLLLRPSDEQLVGLQKLIDGQHDPGSANYQQWLTPDEYGAKFGPSTEDLQQIRSWLERHGFAVANIGHGSQWIEFSGSVVQVEQAFHTEMHHYEFNGERHVANAQEISLPKALLPVVHGLLSLHNFPKRPLHGKLIRMHRDPVTGEFKRIVELAPDVSARFAARPEFTISDDSGTFHLLTPGDWSRIYNTGPLLAEGLDGDGISIAIVGSDSGVQLSDIRTFREIFGLPRKDPIFIVNGIDPGVVPLSAAEEEADLDIEWSGAIAPKATIKFVTSATTASTSGFDLSIAYIVDHRLAPIMSVSIGACELFLGPAGNAFLNSAYQQAAAEGISVISAAGDTGAAGCDSQVSFSPAQGGPAVNGSASTPYDVAVGGTMFAENGLDAMYWNANNRRDLSSAVEYIPEVVWNESCDPTTDANQCFGTQLYFLDAGSGGPSNCVQSTVQPGFIFTCDAGYAKPSWQTGTGVVADGARDLPDISLAAGANHDGYLLCVEGSCQTSIVQGRTTLTNAAIVGGTSAGAPSFAGVIALLEEKKRAYQGLLNYRLYQLAAMEDDGACNSSKQVDPAGARRCVFHDVTMGNNDVPGQTGASATSGYDLATGLGSVDAKNLVEQWDSVKKLPTDTQLSADEDQLVEHGQSIAMNVLVKPERGNGAPSGDFALITDTFGSVLGGTLNQGRFTGGINNLPGGEYDVKARYSGDAMFAVSESRSLRVRVAPESAAISAVPWIVNLFGLATPADGPVPYGQPVGLKVDLHGKSGIGTPGGTLTVQMDGTTTLGPYAVNAAGNAFIWLQSVGKQGLQPGDHSFVVTYGGDNSFQGTTAAASFTVQRDFVIEVNVFPIEQSPDPNVSVLTAGVPVDLGVAVSGLGEPLLGRQLPTGTARIYECLAPETAPHCMQWKPISGDLALANKGPLGAGVVQATFRASLSAGNHLLGASYSGDADYGSIAVTSLVGSPGFLISVAAADKAAIQVTRSPSMIDLGQTVNYQVLLKPVRAGGPVPSGTVMLVRFNFQQATMDLVSGPIPLVRGNAGFSVPWYQAGELALFVIYSGDSTYDQLASSTVTALVNQGHVSVILSTDRSAGEPGATVNLNAFVSVGNTNPKIGTPGSEFGQVEYWDSVDGGMAQLLGGGAQFLTVGNGKSSTNILPVVLPRGRNVIRANFLGTADWVAAGSNAVIVEVGKDNRPY